MFVNSDKRGKSKSCDLGLDLDYGLASHENTSYSDQTDGESSNSTTNERRPSLFESVTQGKNLKPESKTNSPDANIDRSDVPSPATSSHLIHPVIYQSRTCYDVRIS